MSCSCIAFDLSGGCVDASFENRLGRRLQSNQVIHILRRFLRSTRSELVFGGITPYAPNKPLLGSSVGAVLKGVARIPTEERT